MRQDGMPKDSTNEILLLPDAQASSLSLWERVRERAKGPANAEALALGLRGSRPR